MTSKGLAWCEKRLLNCKRCDSRCTYAVYGLSCTFSSIRGSRFCAGVTGRLFSSGFLGESSACK